MKTITVHVDETQYADFQRNAQRAGRSTSDLLREAMKTFNEKLKRQERTSLVDAPPPASVGKVLKTWTGRAELLGEYFER
jgi:negative regulator of replication initiation